VGNGLLPVSGLPKAADTSGASLAAHGMSVRWDKKRPLRAVPRLPRQFRGPWDRDPPRGHDFRHVPLVRQDEESGRADGDIGPYGVANRTAGGAQVPRKTAEDKKVSQTVRTILEAGATPETAIPNIEELTARGVFSYTQYTDKQAMKDAEGTIRDKGYASALSDWTNRVGSGEVSKRNIAEEWNDQQERKSKRKT
jgi:hypothetical protein